MMFAQYDQKVSNDMERKKEEQSHLKRNNQGSAKAKGKKGKHNTRNSEFRRWQLNIIPK
jgi:hypothetical protein